LKEPPIERDLVPDAMTPPTTTAVTLVDERIPVPVRRLVDLAKAISTIDTKEQREQVGQLHAQLGAERRETERRQKADPELAKALKRVEDLRVPYKLTISTLDEWETFVSKRMGAYDREEIRKARERQQAANAKTEEKNALATAKAEETGVKPVLKAPTIVAPPPKTIKTEDGLSSSRKTVKTFRIDGIGPDEKLEKLPANDPRLIKIDRRNLLVNVSQIKKLAQLPAMEQLLKEQGIIVEEEFDYNSRG
jgi:hypothetical protein